MAKPLKNIGKIVSVPSEWTVYRVPDDVLAILGATAALPPQIVLENMVAAGSAQRIGIVTTLGNTVIDDDDDVEDEGTEDGKPWLREKDD